MPLVACPDCGHEVSDRAAACLKCGFPIAENLAEQRAADEAVLERSSRAKVDRTVDCPPCKGRGFEMLSWTEADGRKAQGFSWCEECDHSGHLPVVHSSAGYFGVAIESVDAFISGELHPDSAHVFALGVDLPPLPTLPVAGTPRQDDADDDEPSSEGGATSTS